MTRINVLNNTRITYYHGDTILSAKPVEISIHDFINTGIADKLANSIFANDVVLDFSIFDHDDFVNRNGVRYLRYIAIVWNGLSVGKYSGKIYADAPLTWELDEML